MLATIRDDTCNVLNMQHIPPNSKRWDYSDILVVAIKRLKDLPTWLKVATTLEKPPTPTHIRPKWYNTLLNIKWCHRLPLFTLSTTHTLGDKPPRMCPYHFRPLFIKVAPRVQGYTLTYYYNEKHEETTMPTMFDHTTYIPVNFKVRSQKLPNKSNVGHGILHKWVSEWLNLMAFLGTEGSEVHIIHISHVITAYTLESFLHKLDS